MNSPLTNFSSIAFGTISVDRTLANDFLGMPLSFRGALGFLEHEGTSSILLAGFSCILFMCRLREAYKT